MTAVYQYFVVATMTNNVFLATADSAKVYSGSGFPLRVLRRTFEV
jgi:hypothetical protein